MLKSPKEKGTRGEMFVRDILRGYGYSAERQPMSGAISFLKGDIRTNFPFFLEVKNTETTKFHEWYKKAEQQSEAYPPMVVWVHEQDAYCYLRLADLLSIINSKPMEILALPKKKMKTAPEDVAWQGSLSKFVMSHRKEKYATKGWAKLRSCLRKK